MVETLLCGKILKRSSSSEPKVLDLETWHGHRGLKLYKIYKNNDPGLTLTLIWSPVHLNGETVAKLYIGSTSNDQLNKGFMLMTIWIPRGCLILSRGFVHTYDHYFQTSFPKMLGQSKANLMWILYGKGNEKLNEWPMSHDKDGHHDQICYTPMNTFSRTRSPMKLGMVHRGLKVFKVNIDDVPWLTLTNFTEMSNLILYAFIQG